MRYISQVPCRYVVALLRAIGARNPDTGRIWKSGDARTVRPASEFVVHRRESRVAAHVAAAVCFGPVAGCLVVLVAGMLILGEGLTLLAVIGLPAAGASRWRA
jgi:hypothetical protein